VNSGRRGRGGPHGGGEVEDLARGDEHAEGDLAARA
jgi:hypothetical protein